MSDVPRWFGPAAAGLALSAAVLALGHPAGLGLAAVASGLVAAAAAAAPRRSWPWSAAAVLLAATPLLRSAGWVVALALAGALVLAAIAVAGARTWHDQARALGGWVAGLAPGVLVVARLAGRSAGGRWEGVFAAARGVVLAAALLGVFGALFAAADAAFAELLDGITRALPDLTDNWVARVLAGLLVAGAAGALLRVAHAAPAPAPAAEPRRRLGAVEARIALVAVDALFVAFVAVQLTTLFGGHGHVLRTAGLTYAEYAREGFAELLAAAALTLAVVAGARRWARQDRALRVLLGLLCVCTLVVLASAHRRLGIYVEAYGATRLRLLAQAEILWLAALFALVASSIAVRRAAWLPRAVVSLSAIAALAFVAADPDRRVAERNVDRYEATGRLDEHYLERLSADATPALLRLPAPVAARITARIRTRLEREEDGLAALNVARTRARGLLARPGGA